MVSRRGRSAALGSEGARRCLDATPNTAMNPTVAALRRPRVMTSVGYHDQAEAWEPGIIA